MKRLALGLAAGALIMAAPLTSHAACTSPANRPPRAHGTIQSLSPADNGKVYVDSSNPGAGIQGAHGWLDVKASTSGASLSGNQAESGVNGFISFGGSTNPQLNADLCLA